MKKRTSVRSLIFMGTASIALLSGGPAWAQTDEPVTVDSAGDDEDAAIQDRIIVTGSRIATDAAVSAASPVLSVGIDEITTSGDVDLAFLLRETPALNASLPGSFSAFNAADTEDSDLGVGLLNLRNLGIERTLVLQNGRRHVAGVSGQAAVDTNTIPQSLLSRVEVLTGGASSIYGADAVSGVVNFILRDGDSFEGLEYRLQTGISSEGDAEEVFASIATGFGTEDGKGDIVFSLEYFASDAVFASDRDFAGSGLAEQIANSADVSAFFGLNPNAANVFVPGQTLPISSSFGAIAIGDGGASAFGSILDLVDNPGATIAGTNIPLVQVFDNGTLRAFNPGDALSSAFEGVGGDAIAANPDLELILPDTQRVVFNTLANYEILPALNFFIEAKYAFTDTSDSIQVNGFNDDIPIALDNPFIPAALQDQITELQGIGFDPVIAISRDTIDADVLPIPNAERETFRIVGGFTGELPFNTNYEVSYNFGRTESAVTNPNTRIEDRFFAGVDAVVDPATGQIVCRSDLDPDATPPLSPFPQAREGFLTFDPGDGQCAPINIFGQNTITGPGAEFAFIPTTERTVLQQEVILGLLSGDTEDFFSLPGGAIGWSLGVEYRQESSSFTPDTLDTSGLTFGAVSGGPTLPSGGDDAVTDVFAEVKLPLLAELPAIEYLEATGSVRHSNYDSIGTTVTWAVGGRYQPIEGVTFRGTYSEAIRAPNIGELFSPATPATIGAAQDPCNANFIDAGTEFRAANCLALVGEGFDSTQFNSAFVPGTTGGNPLLEPEEADSFTVGLVLEPGNFVPGPYLENFRVIADFYDIEIDGAIDDLTGFQIASNCVDLPDLNNPFCEQVQRDPVNGNIIDFQSGQINLGSFAVQGVDFSIVHDIELNELFATVPGAVSTSITGTRFIEYDIVNDPTQPDVIEDELGTFNDPEWIVNFAVDYSLGKFGVGWRGRFESSQLLGTITNEDIESNPDFSDPFESGSAFVHDFNVNYDWNEKLNFYGGIVNAFDEDPFVGSLSRPAGPRGRFFFVGIQGTF